MAVAYWRGCGADAARMRSLGFVPVETAYTQRANEDELGFLQIVYRRS
jgi:dihydrofolate reductase